MGTEVYYFSGTGNSLAVARDIAARIDARLVSMSSVIDNERIVIDADVIGIVFPVYYVGLANLPSIVRRFVMKLENIEAKYIFAVCTFGGGSGPTLKLLDEALRSRGGRLAAGFGVQMPQNAFNKPLENREKLFNNWRAKKLDSVYEYLVAKKVGHFDSDGLFSKPVVEILISLMNIPVLRPFFIKKIYAMAGCRTDFNIPFSDVTPFLDRSYYADGHCSHCGICAQVCPVHNIIITEEKPVWQHRCENCLACINWCPQKAIHGYAELPNGRRYHHPDVRLADMIKQSKR